MEALLPTLVIDRFVFQSYQGFFRAKLEYWLLLRRVYSFKVVKHPILKPEQQTATSLWHHHAWKTAFQPWKSGQLLQLNQILNSVLELLMLFQVVSITSRYQNFWGFFLIFFINSFIKKIYFWKRQILVQRSTHTSFLIIWMRLRLTKITTFSKKIWL